MSVRKGYENLSATVGDDGWTKWVLPAELYKLACCTCGLTHDIHFRIDEDGDINMRFRINKRATSQRRRWKRGKPSDVGED